MLKGFRGKKANKPQVVQMDALLFGNRMVHAMALACGQVLREKHGWDAEQATAFIGDVSAQMRANEAEFAEGRKAAAN